MTEPESIDGILSLMRRASPAMAANPPADRLAAIAFMAAIIVGIGDEHPHLMRQYARDARRIQREEWK